MASDKRWNKESANLLTSSTAASSDEDSSDQRNGDSILMRTLLFDQCNEIDEPQRVQASGRPTKIVFGDF